MLSQEEQNLLERAILHVEHAFTTACHFLRNKQNTPLTSGEYAQLKTLCYRLYDRHSAMVQLYKHYTGIDIDDKRMVENPIIPFPHKP